MKNLIIIILLLISGIIYSQYPTYDTPIPNDTVFIADQTSDDSTYFNRFRLPLGGSVTFNFNYVDAVDATITFGYSANGTILQPVPINPTFTLDNTGTNYVGLDAAGDTVYCKSYSNENWNYKYVGWELNKGSLTDDTIVIEYNK